MSQRSRFSIPCARRARARKRCSSFASLGACLVLAAQGPSAWASSFEWIELDTIMPLQPQAGAQFGAALAADALQLAIGEPRASVNGVSVAGRVAVRRFAGGPQASVIPDVLHAGGLFGAALSVQGDVLRVGEPGNPTNGADAGAISQYDYHADSQHWLWSGTGFSLAGDRFGTSLAQDDPWRVDSRPGSPAFAGGYVMVTQLAGMADVQFIAEPGGVAGDAFGASLAIHRGAAGEPDLLVIGAPRRDLGAGATDAGAAYVFANATHTATGWVQVAYLTPPSPHDQDFFGSSVAVAASRVVVGAPGRDKSAAPPAGNAGAVFVYEPDGAGGWQQAQEIVLADAATGDALGSSVAYDAASDRVFGGAPFRVHTVFGGTGATGGVIVAQRICLFTSCGWAPIRELYSHDQPSIGQQAGRAIAVVGDRLFVGAPNYDHGTDVNSGRVLAFVADDIFADGFE